MKHSAVPPSFEHSKIPLLEFGAGSADAPPPKLVFFKGWGKSLSGQRFVYFLFKMGVVLRTPPPGLDPSLEWVWVPTPITRRHHQAQATWLVGTSQ